VLLILHGYGADEKDLLSLAEDLDARFLSISLQAPIPLSWGGYAWYHLQQTPRGILPDDVSRLESEELVTGSLAGIIAKEGGDPEHVILMGFSQGAAVCYSLLARYDLAKFGIKVRAAIALSGYVPRDVLEPLASKDLTDFPVFISHGENDDLIPSVALQEAEKLLNQSGADVRAELYPIGHGVSPEVLLDIKDWLREHDL
jgi:phospholipase/carboxylesterase